MKKALSQPPACQHHCCLNTSRNAAAAKQAIKEGSHTAQHHSTKPNTTHLPPELNKAPWYASMACTGAPLLPPPAAPPPHPAAAAAAGPSCSLTLLSRFMRESQPMTFMKPESSPAQHWWRGSMAMLRIGEGADIGDGASAPVHQLQQQQIKTGGMIVGYVWRGRWPCCKWRWGLPLGREATHPCTSCNSNKEVGGQLRQTV